MAGWTDYIPDWSSKDKLRLCSVYDALSALTAAVNERGSVLSSYTALPDVNRLYPVKYYVDLIDAKIKSIVSKKSTFVDSPNWFVNHTLENNFISLQYIPSWTNGAIREYGLRPDGTQKEMGFFGEIVCKEDPETVFTEISVGVNINGTEMDVPTLVPTLTDAELLYMITEGYKVSPSEWPSTIIEKASLHAQQRIDAGKSPFAADGEQNYTRPWISYQNSRLMSVIDWVYQQYQVINKLKWISSSFRIGTLVGWGVKEAETNSNWPDEWNQNYTWGSLGGGYCSDSSQGRERIILQFQHNILDYDVYFFVFTQLYGTTNYSAEVFPFLGYNYQYGGRVTADFNVLSIGNIDTRPTGLGSWFVRNGRVWPTRTSYPRVILKFDGANGFQFKDW